MMVQSKRLPMRNSKPVKQRLLNGCAVAVALAFGSAVPKAQAQSLQGTPSFAPGTVSISGTATDTIYTLSTRETVINWQSKDSGTGNFIFQNAGTSATFQNDAKNLFGDYVVLNRILPNDALGNPTNNRAVQINGAINSHIVVPGAQNAPGGNIWFYTPGGLIIGNSASFDVGSLVLSASDIDPLSMFSGLTGTIHFTGAPNPNAAINISSLATIKANNYVAVFAPRD
jgi:filamentous hemagglutinin family protein